MGGTRRLPPVADEDWVSQHAAAKRLGIPVFAVGWGVANEHLEPVRNSRGDEGVTVGSLERELAWRAGASRAARLRRFARDLLDYF